MPRQATKFRLGMAALLAGALITLPVAAGWPYRPDGQATANGAFTATDKVGRHYSLALVSSRFGTTLKDGRALNYEADLYAVRAPKHGRAMAGPNGSGNTGGCEQSGSFTVEICLEQYWQDYISSGLRYVAVEYYTVRFNRLDNTWALTNGSILGAVNGPCGRGCIGRLYQTAGKSWTPPTPGKLYTWTPPWHGKYVQVGSTTYQCANATLKYARGSATYSFQHSNICQGSQG